MGMITYLMMEASLIFWAIMYTSMIKINVKRFSLYCLIVILPSAPIFQLFGQWWGIGYFLTSLFLVFFWMSKRSITFIHISFVLIIGILMDYSTQFILNIFQVYTGNELLGHFILFPFLFVGAIFIYKIATRKMYQLLAVVKPALLLILLLGLFTVCTFYLNMYLISRLSEEKFFQFNMITQLIYFGFMLFVLFLTIRTIKKENEFKKLEFETAQFNDYIQSLELINNDMQTFQHDYSNILFTMHGYMENDDLDGLKKFYHEHIISAEADTLQLNKRLANLSNLEIPGIKGLIFTKILQAEKEGIEVNIEIPEVIDTIEVDIIDIARMIGIFFDNAIEANLGIHEQKEINFAFFKSISKSTMIVVENTIHEGSIQVDKLFAEGYSTKGNNRGIGLSNVEKMLIKYSNATLHTNIHNGLFSQVIELVKD